LACSLDCAYATVRSIHFFSAILSIIFQDFQLPHNAAANSEKLKASLEISLAVFFLDFARPTVYGSAIKS
jgi:hypothetical protein